jgi:hypothetical protein
MGKSAVAVLALVAILICSATPGSAMVDIPRGYYAQLQISHDGRALTFGPFVGYYFKPASGTDITKLELLCYNERQFYTDELPADALLFKGDAILTTLPDSHPIPDEGERITPIFASDAPTAWLETRPEPREQFRHFHSTYNHSGAAYTGYWLRHDPVEKFTYNMGGRLSKDSPLYHQVNPESSGDFPAIIEFDSGK